MSRFQRLIYIKIEQLHAACTKNRQGNWLKVNTISGHKHTEKVFLLSPSSKILDGK